MSTASIEHNLRVLHQALLFEFWPCWLALTAAVVIGAALVVARSPIPRGLGKSESSILPVRRRGGSAAAVMALALSAAFLACYVALMLVWEDFAYYDNDFFTLFTLKGHDIPALIWPLQGRFFPLALQEFNLVRHFTHTIIGYHMLPIVELLIFVSILLVVDDELGLGTRIALAIAALLTPSILISFDGLIFPERNELLFLAGLVFCLKRFEDTESTPWAAGAVLCAQIMVYYKETAFILLLGLAAVRLALRCRGAERPGWNRDRLWDRPGRLDLCFIGVAVLYLVFYFAAVGVHRDMAYAGARRQPLLEILFAYARLDLLAWLLLAVAAGRMHLILRRRAAPLLLWDGLAAGGVACFLAYLYLRIFNPWYLAPVDLIALLYLGRLAALSWAPSAEWRKCAVALLVLVVGVQNILLSAVAVYERKNELHAKMAIAGVVAAQYHGGGGQDMTLYFPFADPYVIMEFASYLDHLGLPVAGTAEPGAGAVALAGGAVARDGRCVGYEAFRCHPAARPAAGDLVIVLPDDEASNAQASRYRGTGEVLSYKPFPAVPRRVQALVADLVGNLRMTTPIFAHQRLPDRWMDASVTIWR